MRSTERGFTLIEVLAAIAILGLLYTLLTESAILGLRSEKGSLRRLEASLTADHWLAELETQLNAGIVPPLGDLEEEDGDFLVRMTVEPYDLILPELGNETSGQQAKPVLSDLTVDRSSPLRLIHVSVAWQEAGAEYQVSRTTFGFDSSTLDPSKLPQAQPTDQPDAEAADAGAADAEAEP
jgi:prepilin-type N-terminal cleavage/methylation domain-containing protein